MPGRLQPYYRTRLVPGLCDASGTTGLDCAILPHIAAGTRRQRVYTMSRTVCVLIVAAAMTPVAVADQTDVLLTDAAERTSRLRSDSVGVSVGGYVQFRFDLNSREDPSPDDGTTQGFSTRRTKLIFKADVNEDFAVFVQGSFAAGTGANTLDDAFATYAFDNGVVFKAGQFRMPLLREELVLETRQLGSERSAMNSVFNQGRSQGVQISQQLDDWRWAFAFHDGINTANTEFNSMAEAEYALTTRAEFLLHGDDWDRFNDFTSFIGDDMGVMAGVAAHWQSSGQDATMLPVSGLFQLTGDLSVEGDGWNAFVAAVWRHIDPRGAGRDLDELGIVAQAGLYLTPVWEGFARVDLVVPDDDRGPGATELTTITVGVNHYLIERSHAARITFDMQYFSQQQSLTIVPANPAVGLLADTNEGQWNFRGQLQLAF